MYYDTCGRDIDAFVFYPVMIKFAKIDHRARNPFVRRYIGV